MGRIFVVELEGRSYRCKFCKTQLALADDIVSRSFHSRRGKAYLFNNAVNVTTGAMEERMMLSGVHTVADIFCCSCGQIVGWKYEAAQEKSQKYKEGKFVLERSATSSCTGRLFTEEEVQNMMKEAVSSYQTRLTQFARRMEEIERRMMMCAQANSVAPAVLDSVPETPTYSDSTVSATSNSRGRLFSEEEVQNMLKEALIEAASSVETQMTQVERRAEEMERRTTTMLAQANSATGAVPETPTNFFSIVQTHGKIGCLMMLFTKL